MDKKLEHSTLNDLIQNFDEAYKACGHRLVKVRVGNLISHDSYSIAPIPWKGITMHLRSEDATDIKIKVDKFQRELKSSDEPKCPFPNEWQYGTVPEVITNDEDID